MNSSCFAWLLPMRSALTRAQYPHKVTNAAAVCASRSLPLLWPHEDSVHMSLGRYAQYLTVDRYLTGWASLFTRRGDSHIFRTITPTNGWTSLVNNWHKNVWGQQDIHYHCVNHGSAHVPDWVAIPTIMGEEHPQYAGRGSSKADAKSKSAERIAGSGHC